MESGRGDVQTLAQDCQTLRREAVLAREDCEKAQRLKNQLEAIVAQLKEESGRLSMIKLTTRSSSNRHFPLYVLFNTHPHSPALEAFKSQSPKSSKLINKYSFTQICVVGFPLCMTIQKCITNVIVTTSNVCIFQFFSEL